MEPFLCGSESKELWLKKKKKGGKKAFLGLDEKCMNESKLVSYLKVHEMKTCTSGL